MSKLTIDKSKFQCYERINVKDLLWRGRVIVWLLFFGNNIQFPGPSIDSSSCREKIVDD